MKIDSLIQNLENNSKKDNISHNLVVKGFENDPSIHSLNGGKFARFNQSLLSISNSKVFIGSKKVNEIKDLKIKKGEKAFQILMNDKLKFVDLGNGKAELFDEKKHSNDIKTIEKNITFYNSVFSIDQLDHSKDELIKIFKENNINLVEQNKIDQKNFPAKISSILENNEIKHNLDLKDSKTLFKTLHQIKLASSKDIEFKNDDIKNYAENFAILNFKNKNGIPNAINKNYIKNSINNFISNNIDETGSLKEDAEKKLKHDLFSGVSKSTKIDKVLNNEIKLSSVSKELLQTNLNKLELDLKNEQSIEKEAKAIDPGIDKNNIENKAKKPLKSNDQEISI